MNVTNTGNQAGDEVAQLYLHHDVSSVEVPDKALKGLACAPQSRRAPDRYLPSQAKRAGCLEPEAPVGRRTRHLHHHGRQFLKSPTPHQLPNHKAVICISLAAVQNRVPRVREANPGLFKALNTKEQGNQHPIPPVTTNKQRGTMAQLRQDLPTPSGVFPKPPVSSSPSSFPSDSASPPTRPSSPWSAASCLLRRR